MKNTFLFLILAISTINLFGNDLGQPKKEFIESECRANIELYRTNTPQNKQLFSEIELAAMIALQFYPELEKVPIKFKRSDTKTTMETRPQINTLFRQRKHRKYIIHVDTKVKKNDGLLIDSIPFNALVGLIGHELAHIAHYEQLTNIQIMGFGVTYNDEAFKTHIERTTDEVTINHGLGWQLYEWAAYAMVKGDMTLNYKLYKQQHYMIPLEIKEKLKTHQLYEAFFENKKTTTIE